MKIWKSMFIKNLSYAFFAQGISLLSSFVVQFFCPKLLGVTEFAYWQLFLFYVSYINISRLGIIDGMYLRYGGKREEDLDGSLIKTEWMLYMIIQVSFGCIMSFIAIQFVQDISRVFVLLSCAVCLVIINSNNYFGFLFQAINKTSIYSISEVIYNILWFVAVLVLFVFKIDSFKVIVGFYIVGQVFAGMYLIYKFKFVFSSKIGHVRNALHELLINLQIGLPLLIAMYSSMLITGCARMVVDLRWGIEAFSYFSFAMSLTTFILKFISQISMVMFPALKRIDFQQQKTIYALINNALAIILPGALVLFIPVKIIINWWLPSYETSMYYLGILLPICIFDGKMQLLYSTYLKVLRKEKYLLVANLMAVCVSFLCALFGAYTLNSLEAIAWALLCAIAFRSLFSSVILNLWMKIKVEYAQQITELVIIFLFVVISTKFSNGLVFGIYLSAYILYLALNYKTTRNTLRNFWRLREGKGENDIC